ncbi:MAG: class I SAM-dependent methyltransferase [Kofleriaceae bacterium]|nr:class I SAM-dependent methyltransferase [Kofleriaceae bacterium]
MPLTSATPTPVAAPAASLTTPATPRPLPWPQRLARQLLLARLGDVTEGVVRVRDADGERRLGRATAGFPVDVTIEVLDPRAYVDAVLGGTLGIGEAYMAGAWRCDDLTGLIRLMVRNRAVMQGLERGLATATAPLRRAHALLTRNTRAGSRRNIAAHYDLGDDFFRLFLDDSLTYSCALYERPGMSLGDAQVAKYDKICRQLRLGPADHVVEIGTGWGGFAIHAASRYGCRVTTTTISRRQHAEATRRVAARGLADRVEVRFDDYRDLRGTYDKLVSIEMIEAVGREHFDAYFGAIERLLRPDGEALIQAILISDQDFAQAAAETDFLKRHIFPGSCIPSVTALLDAATRSSDLRLRALDDLTPHYATTLDAWRRRLLDRRTEARALGFDDVTLRAWDYYLAYCEGGFRERYIGVSHLHLVRPGWRDPA